MLSPKVLGLGGIDSAVFLHCLGIALELKIWHGSNVCDRNKLPTGKIGYWLSADSKKFHSGFLEIVEFWVNQPSSPA